MNAFEVTATEAAPALGALGLRALADRLDWPEQAALAGRGEVFAAAARPVLRARGHDERSTQRAADFLRGLAAGYAAHAATVSVETVWSGPSTHAVPVRATAQALIQVVAEARHELCLLTYSAKPHPQLREALSAATQRGVRVSIVVETLQGAGSALGGAEPAAAFFGIGGIELWHWPVARRSEPGSKMHAKVAVADRLVLLVSSANLTQSGVAKNIEAGVLLRGGDAPARFAEHVEGLRTQGLLQRLTG